MLEISPDTYLAEKNHAPGCCLHYFLRSILAASEPCQALRIATNQELKQGLKTQVNK
jgi:hypothetical protein